MKSRTKLIISLIIPQAVGGLSALLSGGAMNRYYSVIRPSFAPPGWVFPVIWPVLYLTMGAAAYLIWSGGCDNKKRALALYGAQLFLNFLWPLVFFSLGAYLAAFVLLIALIAVAAAAAREFLICRKASGILLIPYLLWLIFAAFLNYAVYVLNRAG